MEYDVSILIPTHNRAAILRETIESLARVHRVEGTQVELVVVANACTDDTTRIVAEARNSVPFDVLCVEEPVAGLNVARNRCAHESRGRLLAYLDDDVLLDPNWLRALVDAFSDPRIGIVGGRVLLYWQDVQKPAWMSDEVAGLLSDRDLGDDVRANCDSSVAIGANMAFRREVYDAVHGFRPGLDRVGKQTLSGGETDFIRRAIDRGFAAIYAPRMLVHHRVSEPRLSTDYLDRVAFGNGASAIFAVERMTVPYAVRRTLGAVLHALGDRISGYLFALRGDQKRAKVHRSRWKRADGVLWGTLQRLRGRHPTRNRHASTP